ncbi:hypothetical protein [Wolbachia phage WO]|nr:conserved hypothetical protein [Wolbachia endosymbiont of Drosophila simulans]BAA89632.1 hypothetical protein [Wolbachia phage WO]
MPVSPIAAIIEVTPKGNRPSTRNFCSGTGPTKRSALQSKMLSGCFVDLSKLFIFEVSVAGVSIVSNGVEAKNSLTSIPSSTQSAASHFSGLPRGISSTASDATPISKSFFSAFFAYLLPASSLSGQMIICLPLSGDQSVLSIGAFAPDIAVVAVIPCSISASAHFSPSTRTTLSDFKILGML